MISAFDTEDDNGKFIHGVYKDENRIETFKKSDVMRRYLKSANGFAFANNLFYDFGNLYSRCDFDNDILEINSGRTVIRQGRFISLKYKGFKTVFYDLFNYLRMSIADIGSNIPGLRKLKFDPGNIDYCVRDTEIAHAAALKCIEFIDTHFKIPPRPTTAGYAMAIYKALNFPDIPLIENNEYFKTGYFGGRTESFYIGEKQMAVYDINSAYPYAMTQPVPFGEPKKLKGGVIRETDFVDCVVSVPDLRYGLLPIKFGWGSLAFPVGKLRGRWWGIELLTAEKYGAKIEKINSIIRYNDIGCYFRDYAKYLYSLRLRYSDDKILKTFIKLILNSFYGKLATKFIIQKVVIDKNENEIFKSDYIFKGGSRLGLAERDYGFTKNSRVDIAGYITSFVRASLLDAIQKTEPYYCDTDSIFISPNRKPRNVSEKLGSFKYEGTFNMNIVGAKMYYSDCGGKFACKGVPKPFQVDALKRGYMETARPRTWLTALKNNERPNQWKPFKKTIKPGSNNRHGDAGWTKPFIMKAGKE